MNEISTDFGVQDDLNGRYQQLHNRVAALKVENEEVNSPSSMLPPLSLMMLRGTGSLCYSEYPFLSIDFLMKVGDILVYSDHCSLINPQRISRSVKACSPCR